MSKMTPILKEKPTQAEISAKKEQLFQKLNQQNLTFKNEIIRTPNQIQNDDLRNSYFFIHGTRLAHEFNSITNKQRRQLYRQTYTKTEQSKIFSKWKQLIK